MTELLLEDGTSFKGKSFGYSSNIFGEVVFNTSMTGYQEILTDPSYCGQIVTMTYPLIGNYGINQEDFESIRPALKALIVREACDFPHNWRTAFSLDEYLKEMKIPGLCEIDTRKLTKILRVSGTCRGIILQEEVSTKEKKELLEKLKQPLPTDEVAQVSTKSPYTVPGKGFRIVLVDYGYKRGILKELIDRNCSVTIVPYNTSVEQIAKLAPDGVVLSNGPGDPQSLNESVAVVKELQKHYPLFGICMGHQVLSLANGAKTHKMKFGHRGANHPVKDLRTSKVYLTSQNHGYEVEPKSLENTDLILTHTNVNDNTVEGVAHRRYPAFSVQYHPEAAPGPQDNGYLFDEFLNLIIKEKQVRNSHA